MIRTEHFSLSVKGSESLVNDDYVCAEPQLGLFVVADGMGGRPGGRQASSLAVRTFVHCLEQLLAESSSDEEALRTSVAQANTEVFAISQSDPEVTGLGTTLSALLVKCGKGIVTHVGDSRIYLYRAGALAQLTDDHTLIAELVRRHHVSPEGAKTHALRNLLSRSVGTNETIDAEINDVELVPEDRVILATDGLTKCLEDSQLAELLKNSQRRDAESTCHAIVDVATQRIPLDDVTTVVVDIKEQ